MKHLQPIDIINKKENKKKITMLTAYDVTSAHLISNASIDMILVGDSMGNVISGHENTIPVTMEHIIYHTQAVNRGNTHSLVVADMPFLSYQVSLEKARKNAGRLIKEGGAHCVKVEMINDNTDVIESILSMGIPVMAHLGFTPQSVYQLGGYKVQGREKETQDKLLSLSKKLEEIGCFSVLLEMVPADLSKKITKSLTIPTIGIGASVHCDGQVLVTHDLIGLNRGFSPKFSKQYMNASNLISEAISNFKNEVETNQFPSEKHSFK